MVETAAITTKETDLQRARELAGVRRRANGPSSTQEGGFQAPRLSASPRIREMQRRTGNFDYRQNLKNSRRLAAFAHGRTDSGGKKQNYENETVENMQDEGAYSEFRGPTRDEVRGASEKEIEHGKSLAKIRRALEDVDPEAAEELKVIEDNYEASVKTANEARTLLLSALTPWGAYTLMREANILIDWTYVAAILAAVFKDFVLDASGFSDITLLGWLFASCTTTFIIMMHYLANFVKHDRGVAQKVVIKAGTKLAIRATLYIASFILESVPVIEDIPWETTMAVVIFALALAERKIRTKEKKAMKKQLQKR